jgi:DNA polymerase-3 subunit epsilon
LVKDLSYKHVNMLLVDKGRDIDEKSVVVIKDNTYLGYGFFTLNHQINNFDVLDSLIVKNEFIENSKEVILKYLKKNKIEKIVDFE